LPPVAEKKIWPIAGIDPQHHQSTQSIFCQARSVVKIFDLFSFAKCIYWGPNEPNDRSSALKPFTNDLIMRWVAVFVFESEN